MQRKTTAVLATIVLVGILFCSANVLATGFSPSSLIFSLEAGVEGCQTITITTESETVAINDSWAENKEVEWKISSFNTTAEEHQIDIDYPSQIQSPENKVEVCVSGSELGEYHGAMLLKEEQKGNSIIQMGIWIKLTVVEKQEEVVAPVQTDVNTGSSGGGSSGVATKVNNTTVTNTATTAVTIQKNLGEEDKAASSETNENAGVVGITGSAIGVGKVNVTTAIITIVVVILIIWAFIYLRNKRKEAI